MALLSKENESVLLDLDFQAQDLWEVIKSYYEAYLHPASNDKSHRDVYKRVFAVTKLGRLIVASLEGRRLTDAAVGDWYKYHRIYAEVFVKKHSGVGHATMQYLIDNFDDSDELAKTACGLSLLVTAADEVDADIRASRLGRPLKF